MSSINQRTQSWCSCVFFLFLVSWQMIGYWNEQTNRNKYRDRGSKQKRRKRELRRLRPKGKQRRMDKMVAAEFGIYWLKTRGTTAADGEAFIIKQTTRSTPYDIRTIQVLLRGEKKAIVFGAHARSKKERLRFCQGWQFGAGQNWLCNIALDRSGNETRTLPIPYIIVEACQMSSTGTRDPLMMSAF